MRLHLQGSEELALPRERVFLLLSDSSFLAKSLPDVREAKVIDESNIEAKMRVGVSFLNADMAVRMRIEDRRRPEHARLYAEAAGSGTNMKITSDFDLQGDVPTKMKWVSEVEITGVMAGVGSSVLNGFAEKKVKEVFGSLKNAMVRAGQDEATCSPEGSSASSSSPSS